MQMTPFSTQPEPVLAVAAFRGNDKWAVIGMLWFVVIFNYADRQAISSVFPLLRQQLHLTDVQLSVLGSCFMWTYAAFGPFAGWIGDRLSRKWIIVGSLMFWSSVTAGTAISTHFSHLVLFRTLGGLGEAFYFPAAMSMVSDYHSRTTRSRAMSLHQSGVYVGTIVGASLSAAIAEHYGWRASFALLGGCGILLGCILALTLREPIRGMSEEEDADCPPASHTSAWLAFREILRNPHAIGLIVIFMGTNFVSAIFLVWLPTFLYQKFHMSLTMAGLNSVLYMQMASFVGVLCGGAMADALARGRWGGRVLTQSIGLFGGTPFLFFIGYVASPLLLVLALIGFGYFKGIYDSNIFASLYDVIPFEHRAAMAGVANSLGWIGGSLGPIALALITLHIGMSAAISANAVIYLALGLFMLFSALRMNALGRPQRL
jgi:MFS family permease